MFLSRAFLNICRKWKIVVPDGDGGKLQLLDVVARGGDGGDDWAVDPVEVSDGAQVNAPGGQRGRDYEPNDPGICKGVPLGFQAWLGK